MTQGDLEDSQDGRAFESARDFESEYLLAGSDKAGKVGVWHGVDPKENNRFVYPEGKQDSDDKGVEVFFLGLVGIGDLQAGPFALHCLIFLVQLLSHTEEVFLDKFSIGADQVCDDAQHQQ